MIGGGVGKVIESNVTEVPVGTLVVGSFGWCTHAIGSKDGFTKNQYWLLPKALEENPSYGIGIFGMPG